MKKAFATARQNMIDSQIKPFSVTDTRVLDAFAAVHREEYVSAERQGLAYLGEDLLMEEGRYLIEPPAYARLLQAAELQPDHIVLDVGCLTGYTSAILAHLVSAVIAVDTAEWVTKAKKTTVKADLQNIVYVPGSLINGSAQQGPYDVIFINGSVQTIPQALVNQLKDNGKIATFYRDDKGESHAVLYHKHKGDLRKQIIFDAFIPLLKDFQKAEGFSF